MDLLSAGSRRVETVSAHRIGQPRRLSGQAYAAGQEEGVEQDSRDAPYNLKLAGEDGHLGDTGELMDLSQDCSGGLVADRTLSFCLSLRLMDPSAGRNAGSIPTTFLIVTILCKVLASAAPGVAVHSPAAPAHTKQSPPPISLRISKVDVWPHLVHMIVRASSVPYQSLQF